ncbi:large ribosomal subunit protein bL19c-like [Typha latifolia]|uniref:large ribosomal subunit protein bL19c-like n=1 Tax=Typha latifolia TaxID=4733 RepID=UPI003C2DB629
MASAAAVFSLPTVSLRTPKPAFALFSSAAPNCLSISRAPSSVFVSTILPSLILRGRESAVAIVRSTPDDEGTVGDVEVAVEGEETGETVGAETQEEDSSASTAEEEEKPPRKRRVKLGDIMGILNKRAVEAAEKEKAVPDLRTGDVVEIKLEVPENRRRLSIYKGIVISKQNAGIHTTIRIRRIIAGIGVEIVFPVYSPNIKEIKVVSHRKVRRARLYYLRDKLPRLSTFK